MAHGTLVLARKDVVRLLRMAECIEAVERGFLRHARGETILSGVLGTHVDGGGFHVKSAGVLNAVGGRPVFAAKVNANFPGNPDRHGLPTIQGVIALFDAADGRLLALLDSTEITSLRTAAATAVAARYLAPLADVVSGRKPGRLDSHEIVVFDSTGTALEDVAAAALVYERALAGGAGVTVPLGSR